MSDVACARRRTRLAEMLLEKNAHAEAERLLRKVLDMASGDGSGRAAALENLAKAVQGLGKYDEARSLLQDALTLRRGQGDGAAAASPAVSAVLRKLAEVELASVSGGEAAERDVAVARASEAAAEAVSIAEQAREASLVAAAALAATKVPQKESEPQSGGFLAKLWPLQQPGLVLPPRAARPEVATLELAACLRTQAAVLRILTPDVPDTTCLERALDLLTSSWPGKQAAGKPGAAATARLEELREQSICQTLAAFLVVLKRDKGSGAGHSLQDITSMYKERNCAKLMRGM